MIDIRVQIAGQYGDPEGGIYFYHLGVEVLMWDSQEWIDDPSLVFVIAEAIRVAKEDPVEFIARCNEFSR